MAQTYTVKEVAEILGYSTNSIYTFLKENRIKGVRVGKGRFRISSEELNRLLSISKSGKSQVVHQGTIVDTQIQPQNIPEPKHQTLIDTISGHSTSSRVGVPSIHDWFVGLSAIVLGFAMTLFGKYLEEFAFPVHVEWMLPIRVALMAGGVGLLLTDVIGKSEEVWHTIFHGLVSLAYAGFAVLLWQTRDGSGAAIFGLLSISILGSVFFGFGGVTSFLIFIGLLILFAPIIIFPFIIDGLLDIIPFDVEPILINSIGLGISVLVAVSLIWGYVRSGWIYRIVLIIISGIFIGFSIILARNLLWGRALFILLTGLTTLFLPTWISFEFAHQKDRRAVFSSFGTILMLFLVTVIITRVMQNNMADYAKTQLVDKVHYGKIAIEKDLDTARTSLESAAQNQIIITGLADNTKDTISSLTRGLYEGNRIFDRIVTASVSGVIHTAYPLTTTLEGTSLSDKEYVVQAGKINNTVVSDIVETDGGRSKPLVAISVPVFDKARTLLGFLIGYVDVGILGLDLQKVAASDTGEYFVVTDTYGVRMIHPSFDQIGVRIPSDHPLNNGIAGRNGIERYIEPNGDRMFIAYEEISKTGWSIGVSVPLKGALKSANAASIMMLIVTVATSTIMWVYTITRRSKTSIPPE